MLALFMFMASSGLLWAAMANWACSSIGLRPGGGPGGGPPPATPPPPALASS